MHSKSRHLRTDGQGLQLALRNITPPKSNLHCVSCFIMADDQEEDIIITEGEEDEVDEYLREKKEVENKDDATGHTKWAGFGLPLRIISDDDDDDDASTLVLLTVIFSPHTETNSLVSLPKRFAASSSPPPLNLTLLIVPLIVILSAISILIICSSFAKVPYEQLNK